MINEGVINNGGGQYMLFGLITGPGKIVQTSGNANFADQTTIDSGLLEITGGTAAGAGSLLIGADAGSSGSLDISGGSTTLAGNLGVGNNGTITGGSSTASGSVLLSAGSLTVNDVILGNNVGGWGTLNVIGSGLLKAAGLSMNDLVVDGNGSVQITTQALQPGDDPELAGALVGGYMRNGCDDRQRRNRHHSAA